MKTWGIVSILVATCLLTVSNASATTWYVKPNGTGDVPTIQAGVVAASHGDTILCASGTYSWSNQGTGGPFGMIYILRGSADMVIRSESGPDLTILDGQNQGRIMFFQGETELTVEGFTFKRGEAPATGNFVGAGFAAHLSSPVVRDCIFRNNNAQSQGGAYWYGGQGSPLIENCVFENNTAALGGAVFLINSSLEGTIVGSTFKDNSSLGRGGGLFTYNFRLGVMDCLFDGNSGSIGGAVILESSHPTSFDRCTFVRNEASDASGIKILGTTSVSISNVIIALGAGGGVGLSVDSSPITFGCTDIWGNPAGDWVGNIAGQLGTNGNISADPLFCSGGFLLQGNSPCSPGNHPDGDACGVIGVFPVGCGSVAVEEKSWGEIKAMYADD